MANSHFLFLLAATLLVTFGGAEAAAVARRTKRQLQPNPNGVTVTETLDPNTIAAILASLQNPPGGTANIIGAGLPTNQIGIAGGLIPFPGYWPGFGGRPCNRPRPYQRPYIQPIFIPVPIPATNSNQPPANNNNQQLTTNQQQAFRNQQQAIYNQLTPAQQQGLINQQAFLQAAIMNARLYGFRRGNSPANSRGDKQPVAPLTGKKSKQEEAPSTGKEEEAPSTVKKDKQEVTSKAKSRAS